MLLLLFLVTWTYFCWFVVLTSSLYFMSVTYFVQSVVQFFDVSDKKLSDLDILAKL